MGLSPNFQQGDIPSADTWDGAFIGKLDDLGYGWAQPTSGTTVTSLALQGGWMFEPAVALATLTVVAPPLPFDGEEFVISTTANINALTVLAAVGQTLLGGGPLTLGAPGAVKWKFRVANNTWYPWA